MSGGFERFDARPPGRSYRPVLSYADASTASGKAAADSDMVKARFVELVPGARVVQAVDFVSDDSANAGAMAMTWEPPPSTPQRGWAFVPSASPLGSPRRITPLAQLASLANLAALLER